MSAHLQRRFLLWAAASVATVVAFRLDDAAGIATLALGIAAILALSADSWPVRIATALAVLPALLDPEQAAWALPLAGALVALPAARRSAESPTGRELLQIHLDRARRREESVHVLHVRMHPSTRISEREVLDLFRLSDSVWLRSVGTGRDLLAVVDDHKFERDGLERRLSAALSGPFDLGWAAFPADGYSLERLVEHARSAATQRGVRAESAALGVAHHVT
ncbi:MAG: hypothetical protein AVDCRST_MAG13-1503 [uncultured Solirubrobacteraceae bacterium]|uniref:Uncharacterized protein n=1 Tax=uncultured Solirubrobacteraceae bacterium TaxID=1162706 RepID=A0A6J4SAG7_9ACTN|nr:MAG: hypothetical protein AVDCRST_MAG13-1503 [uncultured Solirubrobacteraceae bacterium]